MSNYVEIRGVRIGEGIPKICVPIVGRTSDEIALAADHMRKVPVDIVEWRADWFEGVDEIGQVRAVLEMLRQKLGSIPLLFTFRTQMEGGEWSMEPEDYVTMNQEVAQTGLADLVDVEVFMGDAYAKSVIDCAHDHGVVVIGSNHDFQGTPDKQEIIRRLCHMQELDADIPKMAVMPQTKRDVLMLLEATEEMIRLHADRPVITMSMAADGMISRLCGEVFGSAVTFGAAGKCSAPGQLPAEELRTILEFIHTNLGIVS